MIVKYLLIMWLVAGLLTAAVMAVGFRRSYGRIGFFHRMYLAMAVLFWPIMLLSALLHVCGQSKASATLERICFGWLALPAVWWGRRQLRKNSVDHSRG